MNGLKSCPILGCDGDGVRATNGSRWVRCNKYDCLLHKTALPLDAWQALPRSVELAERSIQEVGRVRSDWVPFTCSFCGDPNGVTVGPGVSICRGCARIALGKTFDPDCSACEKPEQWDRLHFRAADAEALVLSHEGRIAKLETANENLQSACNHYELCLGADPEHYSAEAVEKIRQAVQEGATAVSIHAEEQLVALTTERDNMQQSLRDSMTEMAEYNQTIIARRDAALATAEQRRVEVERLFNEVTMLCGEIAQLRETVNRERRWRQESNKALESHFVTVERLKRGIDVPCFACNHDGTENRGDSACDTCAGRGWVPKRSEDEPCTTDNPCGICELCVACGY